MVLVCMLGSSEMKGGKLDITYSNQGGTVPRIYGEHYTGSD
jgi:hypothetical protein